MPDGEPGQLKLYGELAEWWPLLSAAADYAEEADYFIPLLDEAAQAPRTVLELGSGGGNLASHLKARYRLTLVDRAPGMLAVSRALNPECEHAPGDLRDVRLGRQFDAVLVHDAIGYMLTEDDLRAAIETAYVHCRPGGAVVLAPDAVRETFAPGTSHGGEDGATRSLRYLAWTFDPDPADTTCTVQYVYCLRDETGAVRVEHEQHLHGLFGRDDWTRLLAETGFTPEVRRDPFGREIFVGHRPLPDDDGAF